ANALKLARLEAEALRVEHAVDEKPARWLAEQVARRERELLVLGALVIAVIATVVLLLVGHVLSVAAAAILCGVMLLLRWYTNDAIDEHARFEKGLVAERSVGEALDTLRAQGWQVVHDARDPRGGNIDHVACGPHGVYLIETKFGGFATPEQIGKVKRQARELNAELGTWVTPVICLHSRRPSDAAFVSRVHLVAPGRLVPWMLAQRNQPPDVERFRRWRNSL